MEKSRELSPTFAAVTSGKSQLDPRITPIIGQRVGDDPADEFEHFYLCPACQQPVDMRDLAAVFHHEEPGHEPLEADDAERLLRISERLASIVSSAEPAVDAVPGMPS